MGFVGGGASPEFLSCIFSMGRILGSLKDFERTPPPQTARSDWLPHLPISSGPALRMCLTGIAFPIGCRSRQSTPFKPAAPPLSADRYGANNAPRPRPPSPSPHEPANQRADPSFPFSADWLPRQHRGADWPTRGWAWPKRGRGDKSGGAGRGGPQRGGAGGGGGGGRALQGEGTGGDPRASPAPGGHPQNRGDPEAEARDTPRKSRSLLGARPAAPW